MSGETASIDATVSGVLAMSAENSDVLPAGSVAVAAMNWPAGTARAAGP